jgi:pantoate--beta-alanine ligase
VSTPVLWTTVSVARAGLARRTASARPLVLVPTMGDLHDGHLALVRAGRELGDVVVSIFVNPTQFAPGEDFERYPRRLQEDLEQLAPLGVQAVFAPTVEEMYPRGESTRVEVHGIGDPLCGRHRPGHFVGVSTVCTKLFVILRPRIAVFGQKDAQQCLLLHRLVRDLRLDLDLVFVPTVRERDGLAMSSRNRYLRGAEREAATVLSRALAAGRGALEEGEREVAGIESVVAAQLRRGGADVDYAELRSVPDLDHPARAAGRMLLAVAAHVGKARLIDNLCVQVEDLTVREAPLLDEHTPAAVRARWGVADEEGKESTT